MLLFFFWLVLWLGIWVELAVDKITILPPPPPLPPFPLLPMFFLSLPTILSLTQGTVI